MAPYTANDCCTMRADAAKAEAMSGEAAVIAARYKTKPCRNFEEHGECPYETRCMFAHGAEETRTLEENERDGLTTLEAVKKHQAALARRNKRRVKRQTKDAERKAAGLPERTTRKASEADEEEEDSASATTPMKRDDSDACSNTSAGERTLGSTVHTAVWAHNPYSAQYPYTSMMVEVDEASRRVVKVMEQSAVAERPNSPMCQCASCVAYVAPYVGACGTAGCYCMVPAYSGYPYYYGY